MASPSPPIDDAALDGAVVVSLGANLAPHGSSVEQVLAAALERLRDQFTLIAVSRWWRSAAWPDPADPAFLNGVALFEGASNAPAALAALHAVEDHFGRRRPKANAPRTLDLDLIAFGRQVEDGIALTLPHPRAHQRLFVMGPLAEIAPSWRHPVSGRTALQLAEEAPVGRDAHPL